MDFVAGFFVGGEFVDEAEYCGDVWNQVSLAVVRSVGVSLVPSRVACRIVAPSDAMVTIRTDRS